MGHDTTPAGDVYSLGVVGYECVAGRRPFVADSPVSIAMMHVRDTPPPLPDSTPAPVRRLLDDAMAKNPLSRYPDGEAFADAVADVRAGLDPRPPSAFMAAGAAGAAGAAAGFAAGRASATSPTTVLAEGTETMGTAAGRAEPTRAYTRVQSDAANQAYGQQTARGQQQGRPRTAQAPVQRPPAPPVTRRPPQRGGGGLGAWFLVVFVLVAALAVAGAIALSNAGVFGPGGLFGGSTTPRSTPPAPVTTTTTQAPAPAPEPQPTPTPVPQPPPTPPSQPPTTDLQDMLDSLTSEFSSWAPAPGNGQAGQDDGPNAQGQGQGQEQSQGRAQGRPGAAAGMFEGIGRGGDDG